MPGVVLQRALEGHPNVAVTFNYDSSFSHVAFRRGRAPKRAQSAKIDVRQGWTMQSFGPSVAGGIFGSWNSLAQLFGGTLLSLMLGLLALVLGTGRRRALSLVRDKTRELRTLAGELEDIVGRFCVGLAREPYPIERRMPDAP